MVGSTEDSVQVIEQAAEDCAKEILWRESDPEVEFSVHCLNVYEVRVYACVLTHTYHLAAK